MIIRVFAKKDGHRTEYRCIWLDDNGVWRLLTTHYLSDIRYSIPNDLKDVVFVQVDKDGNGIAEYNNEYVFGS